MSMTGASNAGDPFDQFGSNDATAIIGQLLDQYGLNTPGMQQWMWDEITSGATTDQITLDLQGTNQFKQRFPGIVARQAAGLPPISPADYVSYEDQAKQLENQYGLPQGVLSNPTTIGNFIGQDVSINEVQGRVQQGYNVVQSAPPEVRQAFTAMFGPNGDGALASYFLDPKSNLTTLENQATAANISGVASMGGINVSTEDAMRLAQTGVTATQAGNAAQTLEKTAPLFNANVGETNDVTAGQQGIEAQFGLSEAATQAVLARQQARQAAFQGGGAPVQDNNGAEGVGAARPI